MSKEVAEAKYEYSVFNALPENVEIAEQNMWYFNSPIQDFYTSDQSAKDFAHSANVARANYRMESASRGNPLDVDVLVGGPVEVVVRRRLVIKLDWEDYD
jgi:hypothetical protein